MMSLQTAKAIVRVWLVTPFEGGRHQRRIELIDA
jgi:ribose 5-phosphate isomerase B